MNRPRICAAIVNDNLEAVKAIEPMVDLLEVRIDLIGDGWQEIAGQLEKPWIACNRCADEGGNWAGSEAARVEELLKAVGLGAAIIDIELSTEKLGEIIPAIKQSAECLVSFHAFQGTPELTTMRDIVRSEMDAGADICKVVTTAHSFGDNLAVLQLIGDFPQTRMVAFAMGLPGMTSRVLCPLLGGDFTYASTEEGSESAPGQLKITDLRKVYGMLENDK